MFVRLLQLANAHSPIDITPEGMLTEVRPVQSENAQSPIAVTPEGIV
jgi:hypothetical protein